MKQNIYQLYTGSFKGLRKEVWWLALVTFINRAGTMVIPFLSLYLTADLGFSKAQTGLIMSAFGAGSLLGAWIGGRISDRVGFYPVMFITLMVTGTFFIALQFIKTFEFFLVSIFILMVVADGFRPAAYVAINTYSKPENRTRSVTLIRLAINLGFAAGPATGGFIIGSIGYNGLFWADGLTCIAAALLFIALLKRKDPNLPRKKEKANLASPYKDGIYILFLFAVILIGFVFMQLFSTIPLFFKEIHGLNESKIGLLMAMNGILIFVLEMPLVKYLENPRFSLYSILFWSTVLLSLSFLTLNIADWTGILIISMFLITIGEMLCFPFLNRFALDRAERGKSGEYMALFTMTFSTAQIFCHYAGMQFIEKLGYQVTWYIMGGLLLISAFLFFVLRKLVFTEKEGMSNR